MVRDIIHDTDILSQKSEKATEDDAGIVQDLLDTFEANADTAVCLAANQIGELKRIIVVNDAGTTRVMVNPMIIDKKQPYFPTEECLSIEGQKTVRRYKRIKVRYLDADFKLHTDKFDEYVAEVIQHAVDHCNGVLV